MTDTFVDTWTVGTYLDIVLVPKKRFFTTGEEIFISTIIDTASEWSVTKGDEKQLGKYFLYTRTIGGFLDSSTDRRIAIDLEYTKYKNAGNVSYSIRSIDGYDKSDVSIAHIFGEGGLKEFKTRFPTVFGLNDAEESESNKVIKLKL
jgi:hypothetical protein